MSVKNLPLEWYADKVQENHPFASLLYGDGEFLAASRTRVGETLSYGEIVTPELEREMYSSLDCLDRRVIRGTDPNIINYREYSGGDAASFKAMGELAEKVIGDRNIEWVDGCVWENAVSTGNLGPLLKAVRNRKTVIVGNRHLRELRFLKYVHFVEIPTINAYSDLDRIEADVLKCTEADMYLICAGFSAIPLIVRLLPKLPTASFIDLGSVLDLFTRTQGERSWLRELYCDRHKTDALIRANLKDLED